nr:MAG TPA: Protein of unknown function (DUF3102) [Inoviridae sp.]
MNEMNNVVYGMINYGNVDISEGAKGSYEYIKNDIQDIKTRYIALGFHLSEFDRNEYYKEFGYSSLDSFVLANFNIDNKNLSRILSVYNKFGEPYKMFISEKYSSYSYSQLSEMVTLKEDDLKNITPAMTIRDIREYKKSLKKEKFRDVAKNEKVEKKVLTNQLKCATTPLPEPDMQRPFDERYQLLTGNDLFIELMECLTGHIKNVDKVAAIVKLLNGCGI